MREKLYIPSGLVYCILAIGCFFIQVPDNNIKTDNFAQTLRCLLTLSVLLEARMMNNTEKLPLNKIHALDTCSLIEERCAHIYRHFERIFSDASDIAALWHKMANDEDHHAAQFKLAALHLGQNKKDADFKDRKLKAVLDKLDSIHLTVETDQPSLSEAFEIALVIEMELAERHIESILTYGDYGLSDLFFKMEKYDQGHLELLQYAINSLK
jgi:rubrerythrin